jgi:hypothetical protein
LGNSANSFLPGHITHSAVDLDAKVYRIFTYTAHGRENRQNAAVARCIELVTADDSRSSRLAEYGVKKGLG